jgi:hypothetical protein
VPRPTTRPPSSCVSPGSGNPSGSAPNPFARLSADKSHRLKKQAIADRSVLDRWLCSTAPWWKKPLRGLAAAPKSMEALWKPQPPGFDPQKSVFRTEIAHVCAQTRKRPAAVRIRSLLVMKGSPVRVRASALLKSAPHRAGCRLSREQSMACYTTQRASRPGPRAAEGHRPECRYVSSIETPV